MNDPAMPFLSRALVAAELQPAFARLVPDSTKMEIAEARLVRHKPGRRALIEYIVEFTRNGAPVERRILVGKLRASSPDEKTFAITKQLSAEFETMEPEFVRVPPPLGIVPEFNMWLQEKVTGHSATKGLLSKTALTLAPRVAQAAHKIHRSRVAPPRTHTLADELRILDDRLAAVGAAKPDWKPRLNRLSSRCHKLANGLPPEKLCAIHRDFHPGQMLIDGERLWLVDFDLFSLGDPAVDVGNFIAHITELSLRHLGDEQRLSSVERAIEDEYIILADENMRDRIRAYTLLSLARHIFISTQFEDRRPFTEALLTLCEERLPS